MKNYIALCYDESSNEFSVINLDDAAERNYEAVFFKNGKPLLVVGYGIKGEDEPAFDVLKKELLELIANRTNNLN